METTKDGILKIAIKNELFGDDEHDAKKHFREHLIKKIKLKKINRKLVKQSKALGSIELGYDRPYILEKLFNKIEDEVLVMYSDKAYDEYFSDKKLERVVDTIYTPINTNLIDIVESIESYRVKHILIIDPILSMRADEIQLAMPDYNIVSFTEQITSDIIENIQK